MILWLQFFIASAFIVASGFKIAKYGDVIAEKTGLGKAWVGLILMASITSLPELITGISSVTMVGAPDIALGDIMGSCVYNLVILAVMDALNKDVPIFKRAYKGHFLSSGFAVVLIAVPVISIMFQGYMPSIGHVGLYTPIIIVLYLVGLKTVYNSEKAAISEYVDTTVEALEYEGISLKSAIVHYVINAVVIVLAATWLPFIADGLAETTGLGGSFVGTVFVAMTTSLPEVAVSIAAVRLGAHDMAIANMLGSNMFNVVILAVDDIFYTAGPLFADVSESHALTGLMAIVMTAVVVIGLAYPKDKKVFGRLGWDTASLLGLWGLTIYMLYATSGA
jgi:cation:H+ antiporter